MARKQRLGDRLSGQSVPVKIALLLVILCILGGVYYYFFYDDMVTQKARLQGQTQKLIKQEQDLQTRKNEYQVLLQQKKEVEARLQQNAVMLPESSELPAFYQHLETQAAAANVQVVYTKDKEVAVESYIKVPVKVEAQGDFYQLNKFFKLLSDTPRIISVENLLIGDPKRDGERVVLTAKFVAATFRQADRPKPIVEKK
jgi:type IV pilus assembly protein PilO